ncbi:MAG: glycerate kinase [Actinobacteria bacterium]|nr:glycerate kinase [Actinomycetota bacterium]MCG2801497.1 glycerate kinase [Cellulomonas sp.]
MRVVVTSDRFGHLDPAAATAELAAGWRAGAPHDEAVALPGSDGGPGLLSAVLAGLGGRPLAGAGTCAVVTGTGSRATVWLQAGTCPGPTSTGLGRALRVAIGSGAGRVVMGTGGTGAPDGGLGLLVGLGLDLPPGARDLAGATDLTGEDLVGLVPLRRSLSGIDLVVAYDDDRPLLGLAGVGELVARSGPDGRARAQVVESGLAALSQAVSAVPLRQERPDLLAGTAGAARRPTSAPGSGSGGGLGFMLAALGARLLPGASVLASELDIDGRLAGAEVVVVAVPYLDWTTAATGVIAHVAERAGAAGVPVVALAGESLLGRKDLAGAGLVGAYVVADDAPGQLAALATRVARTWSPVG